MSTPIQHHLSLLDLEHLALVSPQSAPVAVAFQVAPMAVALDLAPTLTWPTHLRPFQKARCQPLVFPHM